MFKDIAIKYYHPSFNLGVQDIRNVWLLNTNPVKLVTSLHRGSLVFRLPVSGKCISYRTLKKGLIKKQIILHQPFELLSL